MNKEKKEKNKKQMYFKVQNLGFNRCLEPLEKCTSKAIKAHSIPNSLVLNQMSKDGHVIMFRLSHDTNGLPIIKSDSVGRNIASTFTGLCSKHDAEIFEPVDQNTLDLSNENHLFLLAYRSVIRETHACIQSACRLQAGYLERVEAGLSPKDSPDSAGLRATAWICNAVDCYLYKRKYDEAYLGNDPKRIKYYRLTFDDVPPSIAVSALFSLDDIEWPDDVARVVVNIFPSGSKTEVIFSFLSEEERFAHQYLHNIIDSTGEDQKYLVSKLVLQHCENFVIAPDHFSSWSDDKKQSIIHFFCSTLFQNLHGYEDKNLYLF